MAKKLSRRDFLKLSATAVSTAAVGAYVPEALAAPVKAQAACLPVLVVPIRHWRRDNSMLRNKSPR